jgi:hypothetical protein
MNRIIKNIVPVCILIATILACKLPISATPSPEDVENQAGTAVAATLTAMSPEPHGDVTLEPTREIEITSTSLPAPTETPIPDVSVLRFAYTDRNWNLWTWQEGSSPNQIIASGDVDRVALSSDGEWIAFSRVTADFLETSLWAIRFDGSEEHLLINHSDFMAMPLSSDINSDWVVSRYPFMLTFIPSSNTTLAFITVPQFEGPGFIDNKDLWLVDVETGMRNNLLTAGTGGHFYYSPNGSQIALVTGSDISLVNSDGTNRRSSILIYEPVLTYSEYEYHAFPQWSPDGSFLRVAIPYSDSLGDPGMPGHLYQLPTDGSPAFFLGNVNFAPITSGHYSPDLTQLAYVQKMGALEDNNYALMTSNFDGTEPVEIVQADLSFAAWSPDSNQFAYNTWTPRSHFIAQSGVAGSGVLATTESDQFTWVSSDRFIYLSMASPNWEIRLGSIGAPSTLIATLPDGDRFPSLVFNGLP